MKNDKYHIYVCIADKKCKLFMLCTFPVSFKSSKNHLRLVNILCVEY